MAKADQKPAPEAGDQKPAELTQHERENAALKAVLKAHGVEHELDKAQLEKMTADNMAYEYTKPAPDAPATVSPPANPPVVPASPPAGLTREDLQKMSHDEINKRWAEVQKVLES